MKEFMKKHPALELRELLFGYGVMELEIFLSEEPPKQHPISGK